MKHQEEITIQSLAEREDIQIGYSDNDIVIVDSIQRFTETNAAHVAMNSIVICTKGKIQAQLNGQPMVLQKNQVAIAPQKMIITDVMVSPDFDIRAMFLTNRILQSFLREKMYVWNDMMYVQRMHIITMENDDILFYTYFYNTLKLAIERGQDNPYRTDIIQSILRGSILGLCGSMKQRMAIGNHAANSAQRSGNHFQRFLDLLQSSEVKYRSVEDYANELCITPKYLSAVCKKHSGKTANEWIRDHVLEDIRYYLRQTDLSISQVADKLGFANPSFFSKYVRMHFGMTPVQFRQNGA